MTLENGKVVSVGCNKMSQYCKDGYYYPNGVFNGNAHDLTLVDLKNMKTVTGTLLKEKAIRISVFGSVN
ncbi:hypothetical protein [Crassaminicella profunda]|uniref:hypothetical protein n=1 Tax=Crassaminicella profunda TaxID=1286698 RepID=UPI001CA775A4|nr:hypothetical protein [Crassaminicella profunda]QZY56641.1 hypothetical protein K7H06_06900 [Crassaminicella profunda]